MFRKQSLNYNLNHLLMMKQIKPIGICLLPSHFRRKLYLSPYFFQHALLISKIEKINFQGPVTSHPFNFPFLTRSTYFVNSSPYTFDYIVIYSCFFNNCELIAILNVLLGFLILVVCHSF